MTEQSKGGSTRTPCKRRGISAKEREEPILRKLKLPPWQDELARRGSACREGGGAGGHWGKRGGVKIIGALQRGCSLVLFGERERRPEKGEKG